MALKLTNFMNGYYILKYILKAEKIYDLLLKPKLNGKVFEFNQ
jgi:hypothetical protein